MAKDIVSPKNHTKHRWTEEEVIHRLRELGHSLEESYTGRITDKHLITFSTGKTKKVILNNVLKGNSSGSREPYPKHTSESIKGILDKIGATLNEEFKGNIMEKHSITFSNGLTKNINLDTVIRGKSIGKHNTTKTINERFSSGRELAEEFKGSVNKKHLVKFECGHIHNVLLSKALPGRGIVNGCPSCAEYGFNNKKPAYFYCLEILFEDQLLYKVGVTNRTVEDRYYMEDVNYKIKALLQYSTGEIALNIEAKIINIFKQLKYEGLSPFRHTGIKELFTKDISKDERFHEILRYHSFSEIGYSTFIENT
jgi:hypothetical protein